MRQSRGGTRRPPTFKSRTYTHTHTHTHQYLNIQYSTVRYGVATVSRIDKIIGLFSRIASLLQVSFAKETYYFIDPTNCSHPIVSGWDKKASYIYALHICTYTHNHTQQYLNMCNIQECGSLGVGKESFYIYDHSRPTYIHIHTHTHSHKYLHMSYSTVWQSWGETRRPPVYTPHIYTHTHTHTHQYLNISYSIVRYIYMCVYIYVCVCICMYMFNSAIHFNANI